MITIDFHPSILSKYFDLKVREQCRSCKRYGKIAQCPPYLPEIEHYKNLLPTYKYGLLVYKTYNTETENWQELGRRSSLEIHAYLLEKRQLLFDTGHYYSIALGAGSCKQCSKCTIPCQHPDSSLVPIEGCGVDVVRLMRHFGIEVIFPLNTKFIFYRIGMILWD